MLGRNAVASRERATFKSPLPGEVLAKAKRRLEVAGSKPEPVL